MLLRDAQPADAVEVAGVHVRSWQVGYRGIVPDEYLDALRAEDRAPHYRFGDPDPRQPATIVALESGAICGFATTGPCPDADHAHTGELLALYVDPDRWGLGIGRTLLQGARTRLSREGFTHAILWVLEGNRHAERFYRLDGWAPNGGRREEELWGVTVPEIGYGRPLA